MLVYHSSFYYDVPVVERIFVLIALFNPLMKYVLLNVRMLHLNCNVLVNGLIKSPVNHKYRLTNCSWLWLVGNYSLYYALTLLLYSMCGDFLPYAPVCIHCKSMDGWAIFPVDYGRSESLNSMQTHWAEFVGACVSMIIYFFFILSPVISI